jgi:uncharacterized protein (UPF0254 family)
MLLLFSATLIVAKTIYKSKDAEGNIIFSDIQPLSDSETFTITSSSAAQPNNGDVNTSEEETTDEKESDSSISSLPADKNKKETPKTLKEQIQQTCEIYRNNLSILEKKKQLVFSVDADGNKKFFSDEERAKEIETLQENIEAYCQSSD